jgi:phosphoglucomutase/phosphomannomutase
VPPHDTGIVNEVDALTDLSQVKLAGPDDRLIEIVPTTLDAEYLKAIAPLQHFPEECRKQGSSLHIVYTSLHGTGITMVPKALKEWGFTSVHLVDEQITPDGDFPTVQFPNPEYKEALALGIAHLKKTGSDIVLATDPDADRIGVVVQHQGEPVLINGNEMAAICMDYLCEVLTTLKKMPARGAFVTTIVTTELLKKIAAAYHKPLFEVLTGFKYIGEKIHLWEMEPNGHTFIFGGEESYGYLLGTHARDKDAIISSCLIAEIALYEKLKGHTLIDRLHSIYKKYGIFREKQMSLNFSPGKEGMETMSLVMEKLRSNPPQEIDGQPVVCIEDYDLQTRLYTGSGKREELDLPPSDVLLFRLKDNTRLVIRPSGTEPKIKIYGGVASEDFASVDSGIKECDARLDSFLQALKKEATC